jgi:hypothetical protein
VIFSRPIFLEVINLKNYGGVKLEMEKNCELQHHLNYFFEKSLDLDCKNELSFALFR